MMQPNIIASLHLALKFLADFKTLLKAHHITGIKYFQWF